MIKAIIIGVSKYNYGADLPKCRNDIEAIKKAFIVGLNAKENNLLLCGKNGIVNRSDFDTAFNNLVNQIDSSDTFIFYFSGHGTKSKNTNFLVFSDLKISVEELINRVDSISCRNKIIILDSCYSGNKNVNLESQIDINETADQFVGHGCAIMASCDFEEYSEFDHDGNLSLYTHILYDAFTARALIKQGRKSLEDIKTYIDRLVNIANKNGYKQHNAFRSNIIGTIFFDIEKYEPYKSQTIYKETDKYIIYSVKPSHSNVKRISIEVILRFPCSPEELAVISNEINKEAIYYEVFNDKTSELRFKGKPNNIIFAYYGYDENDIINNNYAYRTVWTDENQDRSYWYRTDKQSVTIDDVHIYTINYYDFSKKFISDNTADNDTLIVQIRNCMYKMIVAAEKFRKEYREYINKTISEQELISNVRDILAEIRKLYYEQSDFPFASNELHDFQNAYSNLAATIDDFAIYYSEKGLKNWDSCSRMVLVDQTIKKYNAYLDKVKLIDAIMSEKFNDLSD